MVRWLVLATVLASAAGEELVFRVPDIQVRHAAAARPVGTARGAAPAADAPYEEYFVEHDVSTSAARKAARDLVIDEEGPAGCGACGRRERQYCARQALADHCCCDRFVGEPFPWLPHACYLGAARCRPRATDCAAYARLRDCCCLRPLAHRWKGILSSSPRVRASLVALLLTTVPCMWGRHYH